MLSAEQLGLLADSAQQHLRVLSAPTSLPAHIADANAALDVLKQTLHPTSAIHLSTTLLSPIFSASQTIPSLNSIHYAFHILDFHLLNAAQPWTDFPDDLRAGLRSFATTVLSRLLPSHPSLLVNKAVALIVGLALREWPQRWPHFLDQLLAPSTPSFIACRVLHDLSDHIHQFSDRIQPARRADLRLSMARALPQTLSYTTSALQAAHDAHDLEALSTVLASLNSFVSWADLRPLFAASVPNACTQLLSHPSIRDSALATLDILVARNFPQSRPSDTNAPSQTSFRDVLIPGLLNFAATSPSIYAFAPYVLISPTSSMPNLSQAASAPPQLHTLDADEHDFAVRFFAVLAQLGSTHFASSYLLSRARDKPPQLDATQVVYACAFIDLLASALSTPSAGIRFAILPFFTSTLSTIAKQAPTSPAVAKGDIASFLLSAFIHAASAAVLALPNDPVAAAFADLDDDDNSSGHYANAVQSRIASAFSLVGKLRPAMAVELGIARMLRLLSMIPKDSTSKPSTAHPVGGARHRSIVVFPGAQHEWTFGPMHRTDIQTWMACFDAACLFVDGIAPTVVTSGDASVTTLLHKLFRQAFDVVISCDEPSFLLSKPQALRVLYPLYIQDESALNTCLQSLMSMATMHHDISRDGIRSRVLGALSAVLRRLANVGVKYIGTFSDALCGYTMKALASMDFRSAEKMNLLEATLAAVMTQSNLSAQAEGAEKLLGPLLQTLGSENVAGMLGHPEKLLQFLQSGSGEEVEQICIMFVLVEAGMHQVVRPTSKRRTPIELPGMLSMSIAPKAAEVACTLVLGLHGLFALAHNSKTEDTSGMEHVLLPTARELTMLLNLDTAEGVSKSIAELVEPVLNAEETRAAYSRISSGEKRSREVLRANGVTPPDKEHSRMREQLRDLRRAGYEMMRAAILSGAARSGAHVRAIVQACCREPERVEPLHLVSIVNRVVGPLVSYIVCGEGLGTMGMVGEAGLTRLLQAVEELVMSAQQEVEIFSASKTMDVAREYGRRMGARAAADMIMGMFPRLDGNADERCLRTFVPEALRTSGVAEATMRLWCAVCDARGGVLDYGAARVGLNAASIAVELAREEDLDMYATLIPSMLRTAVLCSGGGGEAETGTETLGALSEMVRRWGRRSGERMLMAMGDMGKREEVIEWTTECVKNVLACSSEDDGSASTRAKRRRAAVRSFVERVAVAEGVAGGQTVATVHALPEKLPREGPSGGKRKRGPGAAEDPDLTEHALDSLFGGGEPL